MRLFCYPLKTIIYFLFLFVIISHDSYGQSYGLGFSSYGAVQDKRTSLDLSSGRPMCFKGDFQISFEMSFLPNNPTYFGYVMRIVENDQLNIDLVYNAQVSKNHFNIIVGEKLSNISFDIDPNKLFNQWNKLQVKFDVEHSRIIFYSGHSSFIQNGVHLKKNACYKILFGVNNYNKFQTTDTPPMKVRDVRLAENGQLKYNWPLNEESGNIAHEVIEQNDGAVVNPLWITAMHHDWQFARNITVSGVASIAFNAQNGVLYIVSNDSLYSYSIGNLQWHDNLYPGGKLVLNTGNQSVYNPFDKSLYNFYTDQKILSKYDFNTHNWDKKFTFSPETNYWHVNKFFSKVDTSLYVLGGYGHLVYKNKVQQFHFNSHKWQSVDTKGDFFMPRYLSALGTTVNGDAAYILGGYGNSSGQQILNPKNIYDMMRFSVKDKRFKKLFELKVKGEDFAFANSLVIDEKAKIYYGLVFPQHKYNSFLQLLTGSLTNPSYTLIGGAIPYAFHDTHSFADLYYCPTGKKFIAVTLLRSPNNQTTSINIYTLLSPPYGIVSNVSIIKSNGDWYYIIGTALVLTILTILYKKFRRKPVKQNAVLPVEQPEPVTTYQQPVELKDPNTEHAVFNNDHFKNTILLFGDLQVFDAEGTEITKYFTPLIKELFLMILLYSIRWGRGLSSEKLNEILWYDKSAKSARNNRSVNIAKLKNLLDKMTHCHLSKETGCWKIDIDYNVIYVDYYNYLNIVKDKKELDVKRVKDLSAITQRGNFLSNIEYEWLDTFKSEISNEVIDTYMHFAQSEIAHDPELLIDLANYIFYFDPVNEEAMVMKCKALSGLGKHSLAKHAFEAFIKEYKVIYGEEFKKAFQVILE
jgi:DNA-binding SARP family transcriptional activator